MAKVLTDPSFVPFLMRYPNSVLVIEDAENVILDRSSNGDSEAVSNILNITDGILGDCMNVKIVATFNIEKTRIDKALLRKGRLIAEYEFNKLSKDKTNKILNKLYGNVVSDSGMTLSDIYNYNDIVGLDNKQTKIGF
jgi:ATP-dependent 26S proteasome regulatory subunit